MNAALAMMLVLSAVLLLASTYRRRGTHQWCRTTHFSSLGPGRWWLHATNYYWHAMCMRCGKSDSGFNMESNMSYGIANCEHFRKTHKCKKESR